MRFKTSTTAACLPSGPTTCPVDSSWEITSGGSLEVDSGGGADAVEEGSSIVVADVAEEEAAGAGGRRGSSVGGFPGGAEEEDEEGCFEARGTGLPRPDLAAMRWKGWEGGRLIEQRVGRASERWSAIYNSEPPFVHQGISTELAARAGRPRATGQRNNQAV